ncbi:hypothetical protein [Sphingobacterium yanglingense]|uniref:Uncharacterized protein n=1 Tax=Sphingobacterium yanglingense TaxID=1437280 RepID=A0A4R6WMR9_9SPHI|nr:hypothetical protein [Sphingobacterium yanglingense]TDQ80138.1 hypothetical protein CLV99_1593 [Sphingobacterium yanglingense]
MKNHLFTPETAYESPQTGQASAPEKPSDSESKRLAGSILTTRTSYRSP